MKQIMIFLFLLFVLVSNAFASATRTLDAQYITNGSATLTLPTSTATISTTSLSEALTNKTMSGASNTFSNIPTSAIAGSALSGTNTGDVTLGTANGLSLSGQALSLQAADSTHTGALTSTDWSTFNGKLSSALTTGHFFVGVGGVATDQTATQATAALDAMVGDSGSGGTKGLVPAPASGDSAAGKFLAAGGTWAVPSGSAPALNGGSGSAESVTAAGGVTLSSIGYKNFVWVAGNAGAVTVTKTPSITACTADGQTLSVAGTSDTNTVTLQDKANLASSGLSLNGNWIGAKDSVLNLMCDITQGLWVETSRR